MRHMDPEMAGKLAVRDLRAYGWYAPDAAELIALFWLRLGALRPQ